MKRSFCYCVVYFFYSIFFYLLSGLLRCVGVCPEGTWVAVGFSTGVISILELSSGLLLSSWKAHDGEILQVCVFFSFFFSFLMLWMKLSWFELFVLNALSFVSFSPFFKKILSVSFHVCLSVSEYIALSLCLCLCLHFCVSYYVKFKDFVSWIEHTVMSVLRHDFDLLV